MKRTVTTLAALLALTATNAAAQDFYGSVYGGYSNLLDPEFSGTVGGASQSVEVEGEDGYVFGIAIGRTLADLGSATLRGEIELSYGENEADEVFFSGNGPAAEINVDGDITTTRLFANVIADFKTQTAFTPYVGAGIGGSRTEFDIAYGPGVELDDESDNFSAQLILGSSYALNETTSLFGDVRLIRDFDVETDRLSPAGAVTGTISDDVDTANFNVGISFAF